MFCGNCGKPIAYANAKFCPACGAPVRVQPDAANEPPKVPVPPRPGQLCFLCFALLILPFDSDTFTIEHGVFHAHFITGEPFISI